MTGKRFKVHEFTDLDADLFLLDEKSTLVLKDSKLGVDILIYKGDD